MSLLEANGIPVIEASLSLPRVGRGVGFLSLAAPQGPRSGEPVRLRWQDGTEWFCTALRSGLERGSWRLEAVCGAGGLGRVLSRRYYQGIPAATVAKDILTEAGEEPGEIDLPGTFTHYVRPIGTAWELLMALLAGTNRTWRVDLDGRVWIGVDSYPPQGPVPVVRARPEARHYTLPLSPELQPGTTLRGVVGGVEQNLGKIERVTHWVGRELRTEVWCAD
ncbi:MAG: hypothetical protein N2313_04590 [Meiothermus ruber]|nr:hypothetical protein [Meiothermus ruber]